MKPSLASLAIVALATQAALGQLVLWRLTNVRLTTAEYSAGGFDHVHRVTVPGRVLELRFDPTNARVDIQAQVVLLGRANVVSVAFCLEAPPDSKADCYLSGWTSEAAPGVPGGTAR